MGAIRKNINCPECGSPRAIEITNMHNKYKLEKCFSCKFKKEYKAEITWVEKK